MTAVITSPRNPAISWHCRDLGKGLSTTEQPNAAPTGARHHPGEHPQSSRRPGAVHEVPGTVTVIDSEKIESRLMVSIAYLVRYEPSVYVENSPVIDRYTGPGISFATSLRLHW